MGNYKQETGLLAHTNVTEEYALLYETTLHKHNSVDIALQQVGVCN